MLEKIRWIANDKLEKLGQFFKLQNDTKKHFFLLDLLPALNVAQHCTQGISERDPYLLLCPGIEKGIKECQRLGKKVLISIGGPGTDGTLPSLATARKFAETLYDLFLGGDRRTKEISLRPFGS